MTACASSAAFVGLAAVLAGVGAVAPLDATLASVAVILAFVPAMWWSGSGLGRRWAEAMVIPAAFALTMVGGVTMRRMMMPPLLLLAAWSVVAVTWSRMPKKRWPVLAVCFGLSARAAVGLGSYEFGLVSIALMLAVSAVVPWVAVRRSGPRAAELAALVMAAIPWQRWPLAAIGVLIAALLWRVLGTNRAFDRPLAGWWPGIGAVVLMASSLASWPGYSLRQVVPVSQALGWVVLVLALIVTARLRPGIAGVVWFGAFAAITPALPPTPEHRAFTLSSQLGEWTAPMSTGDPYVVEFDLRGAGKVAAGTPLAVLHVGADERVLAAGTSDGLWRPGRGVGRRSLWRTMERRTFVVPAGERPLLVRHPDLARDIELRIETVGPARPTPPRRWALPAWLLGAAVVVAGLQLAAATWGRAVAGVPWLVLAFGALVARAPVEPLHVLGERLAPDFAMAALLAAWLPAAGQWLARGRYAFATVALLLPLALAAPQLTPPMYGDEPFHLTLMDSMARDHDLDVANNLDLEHRPQNALYAPGWPLFHSPGLGFLLLPGYVVAGRTGALVLLALMGGALSALLARRARDLGVGESRVRLLALAVAATYPLATFAGQIWPELPGALAVAAMLVLAARTRGGRLGAVVVAIMAALIKTRFALLVFPIAAAAWLRRNRLLGVAALAAAAAAVMAVGWLAMGHPFGPYRRLHHLWPSDPVLAVKVVGGLIFDAAGGLLFTAPLWVVAIAGVAALWRRGGPGERALLVGCGATLAALLHSSEWYGGGAPPARYLVAMLPAFVLGGGMLLTRPSRWRRLAVVLLPPAVAAWWALVSRPHFSINPGDGGYWLADAISRRFAADGRRFFPSFLVEDTATVAVPLAVSALVVVVLWTVSRRPFVGEIVRRLWVSIWLTAAAALVLAISITPDRVVELEGPQIRRSGGSRVPPEGTVARHSHRRGWRLEDGDGVVVPLRLEAGSEVVLEGWLLGTAARRSEFSIRWNDDEAAILAWRGGSEDPPERVVLPSPPGAGSHRLSILFSCPPQGAAVLDRLRIDDAGSLVSLEGGP